MGGGTHQHRRRVAVAAVPLVPTDRGCCRGSARPANRRTPSSTRSSGEVYHPDGRPASGRAPPRHRRTYLHVASTGGCGWRQRPTAPHVELNSKLLYIDTVLALAWASSNVDPGLPAAGARPVAICRAAARRRRRGAFRPEWWRPASHATRARTARPPPPLTLFPSPLRRGSSPPRRRVVPHCGRQLLHHDGGPRRRRRRWRCWDTRPFRPGARSRRGGDGGVLAPPWRRGRALADAR